MPKQRFIVVCVISLQEASLHAVSFMSECISEIIIVLYLLTVDDESVYILFLSIRMGAGSL